MTPAEELAAIMQDLASANARLSAFFERIVPPPPMPDPVKPPPPPEPPPPGRELPFPFLKKPVLRTANDSREVGVMIERQPAEAEGGYKPRMGRFLVEHVGTVLGTKGTVRSDSLEHGQRVVYNEWFSTDAEPEKLAMIQSDPIGPFISPPTLSGEIRMPG